MAQVTLSKYNASAGGWQLTAAADDITFNSFTGDGSALTALSAGNITTGTIPDARIQSSGVTQHEGNIDHGSIAGLGDDDHTIYSLADGTRAFTGVVSGVTPTADAHLSTKGYVDATVQGLNVQASVEYATTADLAATYASTGGASGTGRFTAAPASPDGVAVVAGDRILVKDQTNQDENGIYVVTATTTIWDRATDMDEDDEADKGDFVYAIAGSTNAGKGYVQTLAVATLGTATGDDLNWSQFSGAGSAALNDLTDVTITAAASGDFLRYSGSAWVDSVIQTGDISETMVTQHEAALSIASSQITDLGEVTLTSGEAYSVGDVLYIAASGKAFKASAASANQANFSRYRKMFYATEAASAADESKKANELNGFIVSGTYTAGSIYYLSTSAAGGSQTSEPTTAGDGKIFLGVCHETNKLAFNPEYFGIA